MKNEKVVIRRHENKEKRRSQLTASRWLVIKNQALLIRDQTFKQSFHHSNNRYAPYENSKNDYSGF